MAEKLLQLFMQGVIIQEVKHIGKNTKKQNLIWVLEQLLLATKLGH